MQAIVDAIHIRSQSLICNITKDYDARVDVKFHLLIKVIDVWNSSWMDFSFCSNKRFFMKEDNILLNINYRFIFILTGIIYKRIFLLIMIKCNKRKNIFWIINLHSESIYLEPRSLFWVFIHFKTIKPKVRTFYWEPIYQDHLVIVQDKFSFTLNNFLHRNLSTSKKISKD